MEKQFREIAKIEITDPCTVAWDSLTGNENMRYCNKCNANVYNFERMTNKQIEKLVLKNNGKLCASIRLQSDGDIKSLGNGTIKNNTSLLKMAGAILATIVGLFTNVNAKVIN
jgi:hypothetical protein